MAEEPPQNQCISNQADCVAHENLCPQSPPEETEIRRVPQPAVDAIGNEHVPRLLPELHEMVEIRAGLHHCQGASPLPYAKHRKSHHEPRCPCSSLDWEESIEGLQILLSRVVDSSDVIAKNALNQSQCMCNVISGAIAGEQESADGGS